jgi:hypothetical protein
MNLKLLVVLEVTSSERSRDDTGRPGFRNRLATNLMVLAGKFAAWSGLSDWF